MDPPTVLNRQRPPPRQRQIGRTSRLLESTLRFTIVFAILALLKLEPIARNSVQDWSSHYESLPPNDVTATVSLFYRLLNNRTRFDVELSSETPPTIFCCGGRKQEPEFFGFIRELLPEHVPDSKSLDGKWHGNLEGKHSSDYDVFVIDYGKGFNCQNDGVMWLFRRFRGQFVWMTGESDDYPLSPLFDTDPRHHVFGPHEERKPNDMTLTYLQITWWNTFKTVLTPAAMTNGDLRPKGGNKTHFLVYGHGNCIPYRNEAFGQLSTIGLVHQAGKCGPPPGSDLTNVTKVNLGVSIYNWRNNFLAGHFANYRFCLVMEHSNEFPFYVTEKILVAFASGCVPIYYGPKETIHRIFNKKAFVFYDVQDPLPALRQVAQLEQNKALYDLMMMEPILANGHSTVERYFSFADQVKKRLNFPR